MKKSISATAARLLALAALAVAAALPAAAPAQTAGVDPEATKLLHRMTDYMASLPVFTFDTQNTLEAVLVSGQKLEFDFAAKVTLRRPNKLRAERSGDIVTQVFYYNGTTLTLYNPAEKYYAAVAAPATIEQALDYARESLDVAAPAGDLLYKDAFARLTQDVTSGFVVGKAAIGGVKCDQLAFSGPDVDFQIWIADGDKPLPRKYVITTKRVSGQPEFAVVMSNWNLSPSVSDGLFTFVPPQGAKKIDFLQLSAGDAPQR